MSTLKDLVLKHMYANAGDSKVLLRYTEIYIKLKQNNMLELAMSPRVKNNTSKVVTNKCTVYSNRGIAGLYDDQRRLQDEIEGNLNKSEETSDAFMEAVKEAAKLEKKTKKVKKVVKTVTEVQTKTLKLIRAHLSNGAVSSQLSVKAIAEKAGTSTTFIINFVKSVMVDECTLVRGNKIPSSIIHPSSLPLSSRSFYIVKNSLIKKI